LPTFDLYGLRNATLEDARLEVERAIGTAFAEHESSYHGGVYYRLGQPGAEQLILKRNFDKREDGWAESQFKEYPFLLYVSGSTRTEALEAQLSTVSVVLRRQEL
jgi:hypothetical protein